MIGWKTKQNDTQKTNNLYFSAGPLRYLVAKKNYDRKRKRQERQENVCKVKQMFHGPGPTRTGCIVVEREEDLGETRRGE